MRKSTKIYSEEFEKQAQKTISLAFLVSEDRLKRQKGGATPELKALAAATLSLEKAIATFIAVERISQ